MSLNDLNLSKCERSTSVVEALIPALNVLVCDSACAQERRHRSKLPRALRGLMGEANIRYARGEKEDAILMCMEIIRQGMQQPLCVLELLSQ